ncbi:hypothetical protein BKA70DRAFT_1272764 [Coprinopsis sp. MPI-PUGE-AT-0042]|nr:hypothetical protein BKA70DRAFT_1272764 [Coprinopsis sp. MPI-PUGE-AT-0042]
MPVATTTSSQLDLQVYLKARDVPASAIAALEKDGVQANPILPFLLKCRSSGHQESGSIWAVVYSNQDQSTVLYVASCTTNALGEYPFFIFTTIPYRPLSDEAVVAADMRFLCSALDKSIIAKERIYSVFAVDLVAKAFAPYTTPFYDCTGSFCTRGDLKPRRQKTILSERGLESELRQANKGDIAEIGGLCEGFAGESVTTIPLTPSQALLEATSMVESNTVWVHRIRDNAAAKWEIACIAAFTRNTTSVATITKVYTHPRWRRLGCAERLTRRVCTELFASGREKVALFVGFLGLAKNGPQVEGVHRWLELAFDKRRVRQGHW